jgi:hypothetical protein
MTKTQELLTVAITCLLMGVLLGLIYKHCGLDGTDMPAWWR